MPEAGSFATDQPAGNVDDGSAAGAVAGAAAGAVEDATGTWAAAAAGFSHVVCLVVVW